MIFPSPKQAFLAVKRVFLAVFRRKPLILSEKAVEARLEICQKCPRLWLDTRQCTACTCYVDLKAQLSTEKCPEQRWP